MEQLADAIVQRNYLVQLYAIDPKYAQAIFAMLPKTDGYTLEEIAEASKTAHLVNKNPAFVSADRDGKARTFMGMPVPKRAAQ